MKKPNFPRNHGGFFSSAIPIIAVLFLVLSMAGCAEPDTIGLDLVDERASFSTTDTLTIQAYSLPDDSIPTNLGFQNLLGLMHDPVFGKARASLFTEFRLPENNLSFGEEPILDSIRLSFAYTGRIYGDSTTYQNIRVYELTENIPDQDTLYSNMTVAHAAEPIGQLRLVPMPSQEIFVDTIISLKAHFIIPLSMEFGQKILDANNTVHLENIPNFLEYFKGLYITAADDFTEGGAIFNLDMFSTLTYMRLYYHHEGDTVSTVQTFGMTQFTNRINYFENFGFEGASPLLRAQVFEQQHQLGDSLLFVQSMGRVRSDISLPHLEELSKLDNVAINQARLVVPVHEELTDNLFFPANRMLLFRYNEERELEYITDFHIGSSYFGGTYDAVKKQYSFNITAYVQEVLSGETPNNGLTLVVGGSAENAQRVVLRGPGRSTNPMRLELIYTVFE